jgi:hypothetical protein
MATARSPRRRPRREADQYQLALPLAWLTEAEFIDAMRLRGVRGLCRVRYRPNRSRLISLSQDSSALNLHECFRGATDPVLDAIAMFLRSGAGDEQQREAVRVMRAWSEGQSPNDYLESGPREGSPSAGTREQMAFLTASYRHLNRERFDGRLPENVRMRLSQRMVRRFGHVEYRRRNDARAIAEIALNIDLLLEGNERPLLDTMLHEMAHIEAWVVRGHRGHGLPWQRVAERVGCEVNSHSHVRIRRRRNGTEVTRVPDLDALLHVLRDRRNGNKPGMFAQLLNGGRRNGR